MMGDSKPKVLLIEPVLPHYRKDVFSMLSGHKNIDMFYLAGENYQGIKSISPPNSNISRHKSFKLFGHRFYWLKESFRIINRIKPDIIICTGIDFHLIHNVLIFFRYKIQGKKSFYWWSHATTGRQGRAGYLLRKFVYKRSTGIMAYNRGGKETLLKMGIPEKKITIVNNSINKEDYGFLNYELHTKNEGKAFTILYSGRLTRAKKIDLLIKALGHARKKGLGPFKCYIIGDGDTKRLEELTRQNDLQNEVVFAGARYGKENHEFFLGADLFVYPGGIGLSIVHAMSFGLPVITTDNIEDQFPEFELLEPGINGDLYSNNSGKDLAGKMIKWKAIIKEKREEIRNACVQRIKDMEYLPDKQAKKVTDFVIRNYSVNEPLNKLTTKGER